MIVKTEAEMMECGKRLAAELRRNRGLAMGGATAVVELHGGEDAELQGVTTGDSATMVEQGDLKSDGVDRATEGDAATVIELIGDVGAGKTTFTRGLAEGLGVKEAVTSPSYTISRRYALPEELLGGLAQESLEESQRRLLRGLLEKPSQGLAQESSRQLLRGELIHYDFYRLPDPGIMAAELEEALSNPANVVVIEWGASVAGMLPEDRMTIEISWNEDGARVVKMRSKGKSND